MEIKETVLRKAKIMILTITVEMFILSIIQMGVNKHNSLNILYNNNKILII